jgi:hypothetical protein
VRSAAAAASRIEKFLAPCAIAGNTYFLQVDLAGD